MQYLMLIAKMFVGKKMEYHYKPDVIKSWVMSKSGYEMLIRIIEFNRHSCTRVKVNMDLPYNEYNRPVLQQMADNLESIMASTSVRNLPFRRVHTRFVPGASKYPSKHTFHLEHEYQVSGNPAQISLEVQQIVDDVEEACRLIEIYF